MYKQTKSSFYLTMAIATILSIGSMAIALDSANSQPFQHDTGNGVNPKNAISVPINNSGSGTNPNYNPTTGKVDGEGLFGDIKVTPDPAEDGFESLEANQPREVSVNDVAKLLETDLNQSLEQLSTIEDAVKTAEEAPRRIARRNVTDETRACVNPAIQARQKLAEKLEQLQGFVEDVNQIDPNDGLW